MRTARRRTGCSAPQIGRPAPDLGVVDITNYVMIDWAAGHAYAIAKLSGGSRRAAREGESVLGLTARKFAATVLTVIADCRGARLGGIMA